MADIIENSASLTLSIRTSYTCPDKCTSAIPLCWEREFYYVYIPVYSEVTQLHCQSAHNSSLRCTTVAVVEPVPLVFRPLIGQQDLTLRDCIASSFWRLLDTTWQPAYVARCAWDYFKIPWTLCSPEKWGFKNSHLRLDKASFFTGLVCPSPQVTIPNIKFLGFNRELIKRNNQKHSPRFAGEKFKTIFTSDHPPLWLCVPKAYFALCIFLMSITTKAQVKLFAQDEAWYLK